MQALNAPKLAGQSEWYLRRQIENYKAGLRGTHEDDVYGRTMAPMVNSLTTDEAISNVIAHIQSMPDTPPPATIEGDVANGERLYRVCAYCHGGDGMGVQALNAPRAAGMTDWYIERQLQNFRSACAALTSAISMACRWASWAASCMTIKRSKISSPTLIRFNKD